MGKVCSKVTGRGLIVLEQALEEAAKDGSACDGGRADGQVPCGKVRAVPLTGRHKSLLIGCNYTGTQNELKGCINDARRMRAAIEQLGFSSENQRFLSDEDGACDCLPTRENMLAAIEWLVEGAKAGDVLFFHYSGHGGRQPVEGESGVFHETLVPLDFDKSGMLLDSELYDKLIVPLPQGCRLTCVLDSCHSAGALDLPYVFVGDEQELRKGLAGEALHMVLSGNWSSEVNKARDGKPQELLTHVCRTGYGLWQTYARYKEAQEAAENGAEGGLMATHESDAGKSAAEVIAFAGCRSDQTSADVGDVAQFHLQPISEGSKAVLCVDRARGGNAGGALTSALVESLQDTSAKGLTYVSLLERIRQELASMGFSQVPQLTSSLVVDLQQPFALDTVFQQE